MVGRCKFSCEFEITKAVCSTWLRVHKLGENKNKERERKKNREKIIIEQWFTVVGGVRLNLTDTTMKYPLTLVFCTHFIN